MKRVIGYYNELQYRIALDGEDIYTAGNSAFESQGYVSAEDGVGRRTMRTYCIRTAKHFAKEKGAKYAGVKYEDPLEN